MRVEGRGGGGLSSFQRQNKQGNESVIISRNCLPLCLSSPRPSTHLRSLAGHALIKDFHCPKERHKVSPHEWYTRYVLCFYCCPGDLLLFHFDKRVQPYHYSLLSMCHSTNQIYLYWQSIINEKFHHLTANFRWNIWVKMFLGYQNTTSTFFSFSFACLNLMATS